MDQRKTTKKKKPSMAPPNQNPVSQPPIQYPSQPPPIQYHTQPPPNQYPPQQLPNQWHTQPPPNQWQYTSQPSPSQYTSQPSTPQCYSPQPASPYATPAPIHPRCYTLAKTAEFVPFDNDNVEVVPETQQDPHEMPLPDDEDDEVQEVDVSGKKKAFTGRKPREHWTEEQEVALAKAWIQISECKQFGNDQKAEGFWKRVLGHYTATMGSTTRTFHSVNTKWKAMNAEMGNFNGLFIQAQRAKGSGCNDLDVMKIAMSDYQLKTGKQFTHLSAWDVVKQHDKWAEQECFQEIAGMGPSTSNSSKRKSSEYESGSNDNVIPDMNEDPAPPFKSTKSKKKQTASSSSSANSVADEITAYTQKKSQYFESKKEKNDLAKHLMQLQIESEMFKQKQREWKVFMEPHDHITDPVLLACILAQKRELAEKHGWPISF